MVPYDAIGGRCAAKRQNPLITAEVYRQFMVSYLDEDRQSDLDLTFTQGQSGWFLTQISTVDSNRQGIAIDVYEDKLVFTCEADDWQETTIAGAVPCSLTLFDLSSFPLTAEDAAETLSPTPDVPVGK